MSSPTSTRIIGEQQTLAHIELFHNVMFFPPVNIIPLSNWSLLPAMLCYYLI